MNLECMLFEALEYVINLYVICKYTTSLIILGEESCYTSKHSVSCFIIDMPWIKGGKEKNCKPKQSTCIIITFQGPFRNPAEVLQQRYKPVEPTLRVRESMYSSPAKTRELTRREEWRNPIHGKEWVLWFFLYCCENVFFIPLLSETFHAWQNEMSNLTAY